MRICQYKYIVYVYNNVHNTIILYTLHIVLFHSCLSLCALVSVLGFMRMFVLHIISTLLCHNIIIIIVQYSLHLALYLYRGSFSLVFALPSFLGHACAYEMYYSDRQSARAGTRANAFSSSTTNALDDQRSLSVFPAFPA